MTALTVETSIAAPPEVCFDLARDLEFHAESLAHTGERVLRRPEHRLLVLGDDVEFEGRHFGIRFRLSARITAFDPPVYFRDEMTRGPFKSFAHDHRFTPSPEGTIMRDVLRFEAPLGLLGRLAESFLLQTHMEAILRCRAQALRHAAER